MVDQLTVILSSLQSKTPDTKPIKPCPPADNKQTNKLMSSVSPCLGSLAKSCLQGFSKGGDQPYLYQDDVLLGGNQNGEGPSSWSQEMDFLNRGDL